MHPAQVSRPNWECLAPREEKAMATHSSTLAWKIPLMEEPGRLQSTGLQTDTTERLHFHFSLSCIGKGNGNPLQCSCLENPRDGGAWWAAVYGVAQSRTRLKRLSSSSRNKQTRILPSAVLTPLEFLLRGPALVQCSQETSVNCAPQHQQQAGRDQGAVVGGCAPPTVYTHR